MANFKRWAKRKIRNGRVKIFNRWYVADDIHKPYKGELDGMTAWFGRYEGEPSVVSMQGIVGYEWEDQPHHIDGYICWLFWREEAEPPKKGK